MSPPRTAAAGTRPSRAAGDNAGVVRASFRAVRVRDSPRCHCPSITILVERILEITRRASVCPYSRRALVSLSENSNVGIARRSTGDTRRQFRMLRRQRTLVVRSDRSGFGVAVAPRPRVAEPQLRQHVNVGAPRPAIVHRDPHQNVFAGLPSRIRRTHRNSGRRRTRRCRSARIQARACRGAGSPRPVRAYGNSRCGYL